MSEVVDISSTVLIPAKYLFLHLEKRLFSLSIFNLSSAELYLYSGYKPLIRYMTYKTFTCFVGCLFTFLVVYFKVKVLYIHSHIYMQSTYLFFYCCALLYFRQNNFYKTVSL